MVELAAGGMGTVSVCVRRTGTFERLYAVKRLHPHLRHDAAMRTMFLDEARVAGLLRHANVVSVLDVGQDDEGPFLVMDYVEGSSLARFIAHHAASGELAPVAVCAHVLAQVARGLHAAHELVGTDGAALHLVHRDVSPSNVLLGHDGVVRVTDFGIAKAIGRSTHTSTGLLKGKIGYMAPEQLRFEPIDRRTDLFALGVLLFELLTTRRLYPGGEAADVARRILDEPPPDLGDARPEAPPALVELAFRMLAKDRDDRPETAAEVADRLDEIVAELGGVDLASYLDVCLGDEIAETRARIRAAASEAEDAQDVPPARRKTRLLAAFALATGCVVLAGAWLVSPTDAPAHASAMLPAFDPPPAVVTVRVDSRPSGATVRVADRLEGVTPLAIELDQGDEEVTLELALPGYVTTTHRIVPTADERFLVALTPEPTAVLDAPARSEPDAKPRSRSTKRRRAAEKRTAPEPEPPRFRRFD